ncbi:phage antirepressor [Acidipropionibacterium timonense]|uniref:phage antirepressor n=1 Tax=Acidipropionibacterium timonense TaxID=2161818 RepID=UPI0014369029|nr:phage antirepressor [Acidipropionibacterium timonense]
MSTSVTQFASPQFGTIRTVSIDGEPWFVATDICTALDLTNTTVTLQRLDDDERSKFNLGRQGETWCVNEAGLYSLVLASRKPEAKAFKRWVTHEVLPSIRRTGGYLTPDAIEKALSDPDFIIRLATDLKSERAKRAELEARQQILAPKARAFDLWLSTNVDYSVGQIAKALHKAGATTLEIDGTRRSMGRNNLMCWLRENHWVMSRGNEPMQSQVNRGRMTARYGGYENPKTGDQVGTCTPRITAKGAARLAVILAVLPEDVQRALEDITAVHDIEEVAA